MGTVKIKRMNLAYDVKSSRAKEIIQMCHDDETVGWKATIWRTLLAAAAFIASWDNLHSAETNCSREASERFRVCRKKSSRCFEKSGGSGTFPLAWIGFWTASAVSCRCLESPFRAPGINWCIPRMEERRCRLVKTNVQELLSRSPKVVAMSRSAFKQVALFTVNYNHK